VDGRPTAVERLQAFTADGGGDPGAKICFSRVDHVQDLCDEENLCVEVGGRLIRSFLVFYTRGCSQPYPGGYIGTPWDVARYTLGCS